MDRRGYLTGIATTAALGLAGCGGSEGSGTPTGSQLQGLTREDVEQVNLQYREWTDSEIETVKSEPRSWRATTTARATGKTAPASTSPSPPASSRHWRGRKPTTQQYF